MKSIILSIMTALLFLSCAGFPHEISPPRSIENSFGFAHAGRDGQEEKEFLKSMGASFVRLDLAWHYVQSEPGEPDYSSLDSLVSSVEEAGVQLIGLLVYDVPWLHENPEGKRQIDREDLPIWLKHVEEVVERYKDRVMAFEVWNEPNVKLFWTGTDEDFFELTKQTVALLKKLAPDTPVVVGCVVSHPLRAGAQFTRKFLASGAAENADVFSVHTYALSPISAARRLRRTKKTLEKYGFKGELWITEAGFPTGGSYPFAVRPDKQGVEIVKWIVTSYAAGVDKLVWYKLYDPYMPGSEPPGATSEDFFGVAYRDQTLKRGGEAIARLMPDLRSSRWAPDLLSDPTDGVSLGYIYPFSKKDGTVNAVIWTEVGRFALGLKGFPQGAVIYDVYSGRESRYIPGNKLTVSPNPIIVTGYSQGDIALEKISLK